jgi:hypothetical protein
MKIEYLPWYSPGENLMRCGGDMGCGALLVAGDTELHTKWHKRLYRAEAWLDRPADHTRVLGTW